MIAKKNVFESLEEKNKHKLPEKIEIINEMKKLKEAIEYIETMIETNNEYKPLSQTSIETLESFPQAEYLRNFFLYIICKKIENLINQSKLQFTTEFKTMKKNYYISIYCEIEERFLEAITLDISEQPPLLESIIYCPDSLIHEKENLEHTIEELKNDKKRITEDLKVEEKKLEVMSLDSKNFRREIDFNNFFPRDCFEEPIPISKIDIQKDKIYRLQHKINEINERLDILFERKIEVEQLCQNISKINFKDFEKLRRLLEKELGINFKSQEVQEADIIPHIKRKIDEKRSTLQYVKKIPFMKQDKGVIDSETYIIGTNDRALQYVKKRKKLNNI